MELDFDKEIDALLRKAHRDGPVLVGDSRHLDADELSAFAENAMPEKSRALHMAHLADCDRCRKILSSLLTMNAEAMPAPVIPGAITIAERSTPWYKRLLLFPNLAYVMGGLVLVFAGFLGFTVVRNMGDGSTLSQVADSELRSSAPAEPQLSAVANSSSNATVSNMVGGVPLASNSNAATAAATPALGDSFGTSGPADGQDEAPSASADAAANMATQPAPVMAAPPPPPAKPAEARERDSDDAKMKTEDRLAVGKDAEVAKNDSTLRKQYPGSVSQSGPMRNQTDRGYNAQLENMDRRAAEKKRAEAGEGGASGRRSVGGKSFERKQGVWYDTSYAGRPTINVQRGTAEYNRLDGGLRSIANTLGGTVVVVWGAKAYRIQ